MSEQKPPRQTLSFLRERLAAAGIRPKTDLGQNFLIDLNLLHVLADAAQLSANDVVLEVGAGTGSLTGILAERAGFVVSVEIDPRLHALAEQLVGQRPNVRLLCQDALQSKHQFHPAVLDALNAALAGDKQRQFKLVANLPYNVATPVISNLLALERPPVSITATIQRELAERIVAQPGSRDYGALSVWVQSQAEARIERVIPPQVFWPRPQVFSAIIQIVLNPSRRGQIQDLGFFHAFIRGIFIHRRKLLRAQVHSVLGREVEKGDVDALLCGLRLDPQARADQLDVPTLLFLAEAVRQRFGGLPGQPESSWDAARITASRADPAVLGPEGEEQA